MVVPRIFLSTAIALATSASASTPVEYQSIPLIYEIGYDGPERPAEARDSAPSVRDPWERFNRRIHGFNRVADDLVLRPLAQAYVTVLPRPAQTGVSRFFANLSLPMTTVNYALQGRAGPAVRSLGRFAVNTTVGLGGLFDAAPRFGLPPSDVEDFGQTLAAWGWKDSRYLVVPLLGPRTVRDAVGLLVDRQISPLGQIQDNGAATALQMVEMVDARSRMLPIDKFRADALDDYSFVRDLWFQRRNRLIWRDQMHGEH